MAYTPILTYPSTLRADAETGRQPYMSFALKRHGDPTIDAKSIVFMYLPASLAVSDGANYQGVDLGAARQAKAGGDFLMGKGDALNANDIAGKALSAFKLGGEVTAAAGAELSLKLGIALNPFTNIAFEGMTPRTWSFEFKMMSESAEEAKTIRDIENLFRKNMYARKAGQLSLHYPPVVRTQFWDGESESNFLPMIMDSYITALAVTYNESGSMYHDDGAPVETSMSISLSETRALTQSDLYMKENFQYNRTGRDDMDSDVQNATSLEELSASVQKKDEEKNAAEAN